MAVKYTGDEDLSVSSDQVIFDLPYYRNEASLQDLDSYVKFLKGVEKNVRKHPDYDVVVSTLREEHMEHCQVLGNISREDAVLELHHGPMLTLFDYCAIITNAMLKRGMKVNTFTVAKRVLQEHLSDNVQFVVLSKTVHQLIDTGEIFINLNQGIGNIKEFLSKYRDGLDESYRTKINTYIDMSKKFESSDNSILDLEDNMVSWKYR